MPFFKNNKGIAFLFQADPPPPKKNLPLPFVFIAKLKLSGLHKQETENV